MQDKMKQNIRLTESDLNKIIKHSINEIVSRINLQFINGFFYPTDAISTQTLADELELGRIPEDRLDVISPKLIRRGYKLAISNYYPQKTNNNDGYVSRTKNYDIQKPIENPCIKCNLKGLCDSDDCGKKHFRLFKR